MEIPYRGERWVLKTDCSKIATVIDVELYDIDNCRGYVFMEMPWIVRRAGGKSLDTFLKQYTKPLWTKFRDSHPEKGQDVLVFIKNPGGSHEIIEVNYHFTGPYFKYWMPRPPLPIDEN